jgi:hypothetical protein
MLLLLVLLAACAGEQPAIGPRLVGDVTLAPPGTALPTRVLSATPALPTLEVPSVLQAVTVDASFVLVTPTLPPSKTPTLTPTQSLTPTQTLTPTTTVTATATAFLLPTSVIIPITREVAVAANEVCESTWFFIQPRPPACPLNPPNASQAVYQRFQAGHMMWVQSQDAIYVLYDDAAQPRWQVFRDYFNEGMPEVVGEYLQAPAAGLWQPRRGFGLVWRSSEIIRGRLGWGVMEYEQPYSVQVQTSRDGSIFLSQPAGSIFALLPGGVNWNEYSSSVPGLVAPAGPQPLPIPTMIPVNQGG